MAARKMAPIHPAEILRADFLEPLGVSQYRLAKEVRVLGRAS
jgi:plasmid maintenance system antidote protein VapI